TLVLIMVALGVAAGSMARGVAFIRARARTTASAQMSVWDRLLRLPASFFSEYAVGELLSRTQSIQLSQQIMSDAIVANLLNGVFGIFNLILLLKGGGTLFLLGIVLLAIQFFVTVWINLVASTPAILKQLSAQNSTQSLTLQIVRGMNKLRVAAAESRAFSVWAHRFSAQQRATYRQGKLKAINGVFTLIWPTLASLAIVGGVLMTGRAHIDLGNYVAYTTAFTQASTALITIGVGFGVLSTSLSYLEQLHPLLQAVPEVGTGQTDPGVLEGKVAVSQVMFRYSEDRPLVLKGVTIRANPGEFIALVGPSGAGKSSIMRLLLGFDRPEAGVIAYDDRDLGLLDTTAVRRQIGSVIQGAQLLPGTIFTNIAGGLPITRDEAWDAARAAGMDEDIADMPMGMETVVQEGGGTLSGGQRQRLLKARSLALKPKILFFDEATSALDNITQAQVTDSINTLQVTRVVIAHRLSTIKDADKIYVLVAGEVAQSGTYEELIAVEGPFRDLATRQIT
ncbi:MAG TPA: ATP-binding cassette domain-containing protein, partial [Acidimicrobiales bacterium]|nr:ATP-binding cassette domain-containing protein [Acidimicrobiales bacterium]